MTSTRHRCSLLLLPLLLASFAAGRTVSAAVQVVSDMPELVFQSGFEGTCEIVPLVASQHDIIGKDTTLREKNDWVEDLEKQAGITTFRFDYTGGDISQRFVRIVPEPGNPLDEEELTRLSQQGREQVYLPASCRRLATAITFRWACA
jgi:hypothetical protein